VDPGADDSTPGPLDPGPLFLIGPARSGTSLLYKVLCLHPDAAYVPNWVARMPGAPWLAALDHVPRWTPKTQRRVWFGRDAANAYVYGRSRPLTERLFPMPVEGEPLFARSGVPPTGPPDDPDLAGRALRSALRRVRRASGGTVLITKRIANLYRVPFLAATFPTGRFAVLVRDGRAVALSLSKVDWWPEHRVVSQGVTPVEWAAAGGDPWELCARNWVAELEAMESGLVEVPGERVLRLRYEDLITDPVAQLHAIARFAGLPASADWDRRVASVAFPDRNEAWHQALDPDARRTIDAIQASALERYGYG
jgi:omega-hydroxy-beta-dihydromenaquinone-9 sulfotransferase